MSIEWSIQDEILRATQKWPWLVLFCIVGALIGWAVSLIWPTPYRATRELFVGLNVYRSLQGFEAKSDYAGVEIVNANDYKNWQMASLNSLIFMDSVIDETHRRLKESDPFWNSVSQADLASSLHVYWRNAGKWRMVAEHTQFEHAAQAVAIWQDVVLETVDRAVLEAQRAMTLEYQLESIANNKINLSDRSSRLKESLETLRLKRTELNSKPAASPLDSHEHWQIWQAVADNDANAALERLYASFPSIGALPEAYIAWIDAVIPVYGQEIAQIETRIRQLNLQEQEVSSLFSQSFQRSQGLSPNLDIDAISTARTQKTVTRPTGELVLTGSILGMIAWLALWFSKISLRKKRDEYPST